MTFHRTVFIATCVVLSLLGRASAGEVTTVPATSGTPNLPAYVARPAGSATAPGVVVLHGCEGYTPHYAAIADWLASQGYVAVAIDSLRPQGVRNACADFSQSRVQANDARATLAWIRQRPYVDGARLALLGYSMGAIATLDVVISRHEAPGLRAGIAYYPACKNRVAARVNVPLQILDGDADDWTPAPPCRALAAAAAALGKTVTITTYPGATHAFNIDERDRAAHGHHLHYDAKAAADAKGQTLDFLRRYLR